MVLAVRRNSPWSGRSSISRAIVWDRSPLATAPMTRAVSRVGCTRSLTKALTESIDSAHDPLIQFNDFVEGVGNLAGQAGPFDRQADGKFAALQRGQRGEQLAFVEDSG